MLCLNQLSSLAKHSVDLWLRDMGERSRIGQHRIQIRCHLADLLNRRATTVATAAVTAATAQACGLNTACNTQTAIDAGDLRSAAGDASVGSASLGAFESCIGKQRAVACDFQ